MLAIAIGFGLTAAYSLSYSSVIATSRSAVDGNEWDLTVDFVQPQAKAQAAALMGEAGVSEWTPVIKTVAQAAKGSVIENLRSAASTRRILGTRSLLSKALTSPTPIRMAWSWRPDSLTGWHLSRAMSSR